MMPHNVEKDFQILVQPHCTIHRITKKKAVLSLCPLPCGKFNYKNLWY